MNDDMTVVERLERLAEQLHVADPDNAEERELLYSLRNIIRDIRESINDDVRDCIHCGSPFTYRRSDGDIACHDCPGIMPRQYRCDGCGTTGTRDDLADDECPWYDDGTHDIYPDTRICHWCGEQGTPHELARHDCPAAEVSQR